MNTHWNKLTKDRHGPYEPLNKIEQALVVTFKSMYLKDTPPPWVLEFLWSPQDKGKFPEISQKFEKYRGATYGLPKDNEAEIFSML